MLKANTLIRTKLRLPFTRPELVPRPRLDARIADGLRGPLTLITAPAGFGKTTLVAACVAGCGMPVAWLSLDKDDNQAGRFLRYLIAALHEADPAIGSEVAQFITMAIETPPEAILTSLVNDLDAAGGEMALVLDDYQFIHNQAVHESVAFLLEHCPPTFHLVIATRSDPPLPLSRLRARAQTVELRAADLGFTRLEAAQFLNEVMGLGLDADAIVLLAERTEGWIAGLQMASIALQSHLSSRGREDADSFVRAFAGTHRFIMDFMLEEVLAREPEEVQTFLLQTAILTRLTGALCDAVMGSAGGQAMLEALERRNLFVVPLDDERRWYRYHHLFADLLQTRLYQSGADRVARLLSRAAEWCEQDGQVADAVNYALAAQDYRQASDLIAKYWHIVANAGEIETAWAWLDALPEDEVRRSAPLGIAYCWVLWLRGQVGAIAPCLADAEDALNDLVAAQGVNPGDVAYTELFVQLALLQSMMARYDNDFEAAVVLAERALALLPQDLPPQVDVQLRALISFSLASAYDGAGDLERAASAYAEHIRLSRRAANVTGLGITIRLIGALRLLGRLREADAACRDVLAYVQAQGMSRLPVTGVLHVAMSEVLVEQNELAAADAHLAQGLKIGKWGGRLDAAKNAAYALSHLRLARGDADGALAAIREASAAIGEPKPPLAETELLALSARVLVRQGALSEAAQCVQEAERLAGRERGQTREMAALAASRVLAAQCKPDRAVAHLTRAIAAAEERGRLGAALELHILRGLALARHGDAPAAEADLEHALALAAPEGYVRVFLDEGRPMQVLLARWLARADPDPLHDYALHLLSQFDAELPQVAAAQQKPSPTDGLIEPLSQRELEVLHLIALGSTNQEIARQLFVAPGTVKAHTASIYRKLDVANRTEAVARARQLGILS
ncbi:MAG: helix-turn-helix transcriptional regulator [Anaerolineae bacterium]|nr:helix-turn-helix transcriptional regulator [Anaerolineae bacterium]